MRHSIRRKPIRLLSVLLVAGLAACFSERPEEEPTEPEGPVVEIQLTDNLRFVPDSVRISPGTTVRWTNVGNAFHTITPREAEQAGVWERTGMTADQRFTHTFDTAGQVYDYFCEPHEGQGMLGKIVVE